MNTAIEVGLTVLSVVLSSILAHAVLLNPMLRFGQTRGWVKSDGAGLGLLLLCGVLIGHVLGSLGIYWASDSASWPALILTLVLFEWSVFAYFDLQQFRIALDQSENVRGHPRLLNRWSCFAAICCVGAAFASGVWYLLPAIPLLWFITGIICAERGIRRLTRHGWDRRVAIFTLNRQRRGATGVLRDNDRYPFP